jgi:hypothetical protein
MVDVWLREKPDLRWSGEPQRKLAIRTEMLVDEGLKRWWQLVTSKTKAAHDLARNIFGGIVRPMLSVVECYDANVRRSRHGWVNNSGAKRVVNWWGQPFCAILAPRCTLSVRGRER